MLFHSNFSLAVEDRIMFETDLDVISSSQIHFYIDMTNPILTILVGQSIARTLVRFLYYLTEDYQIEVGAMPYKVDYIYGSHNPSYVSVVAAGMLLVIVILPPVVLTSFDLMEDKKEGLLDRSFVMGVRGLEMIVSIVLIQMVMLAVFLFLLFVTIFWIFATPFLGNFVHIVLLVYLQGMSGIAFGLLISSIFDDYIPAVICGSGVSIPAVLISGIAWPQLSNYYFRLFSLLSPLTISNEALYNVINRGWGLERMVTVKGYLSTTFFIFLFFTMAVFIFKKFTNS